MFFFLLTDFNECRKIREKILGKWNSSLYTIKNNQDKNMWSTNQQTKWITAISIFICLQQQRQKDISLFRSKLKK